MTNSIQKNMSMESNSLKKILAQWKWWVFGDRQITQKITKKLLIDEKGEKSRGKHTSNVSWVRASHTTDHTSFQWMCCCQNFWHSESGANLDSFCPRAIFPSSSLCASPLPLSVSQKMRFPQKTHVDYLFKRKKQWGPFSFVCVVCSDAPPITQSSLEVSQRNKILLT